MNGRWTMAVFLTGVLALSVAAPGAPSGLRAITNKTLVAWVRLSTTEQRGGSALTLFDAERFDAIVFGEVEPGRWMAGSDFFRRTPQEQSAWPAETAGPDELLQLAIAYRGTHVTITRNGQVTAQYEIAEAQSFPHDATVLVGLRYLGAMGAIGPLAGEVEEARLYDVALTPEAITGLALGQPSDPPPLGWWTFDDGSTADCMGHFPEGELCGGAEVLDGSLRLDGTGAYMVSRVTYPENQLLFYKALDKGTGNMWDTWLYLHEGVYCLYTLANSGGSWDNISMARSPDGVHWEELGPVLHRREGATWMGTGSTWASPVPGDDRFLMNFSEWVGDRQTIYFAESRDLVHWTRLGDDLEFRQDPRWYKDAGRWDCIWTIARPGAGLYGYWTADPLEGPGVGFGQSLDGVRWEALPPPPFAEGAPHGEAGAVERIGDQYCLMIGANGGMRTLVAPAPEGPFRPAPHNFDLLAGQSALHTYFARFFPTPDGLLVNHHSRARDGQVYFAPLKRALVDADGTLRLGWWEGNDRLKADATAPQCTLGEAVGSHPRVLDGDWDTTAGVILEGTVDLPSPESPQPAGLFLGSRGGGGVAVLVGEGGVTRMGPISDDGSGFAAEETIDREMAFPPRARFRLLLKHSLVEFYLDDILIQCYSMPDRADGRLGVLGGMGRVGDLRAWQLPSAGHRAP